jgi:hypothetical protein
LLKPSGGFTGVVVPYTLSKNTLVPMRVVYVENSNEKNNSTGYSYNRDAFERAQSALNFG